MDRSYEVGQPVVYVDKHGKPRGALVTAWWKDNSFSYSHHNPDAPMPGCNLVFVSQDVQKDDTYGRQIERETSVVHRTQQPAHGNYWCWPDEIGF